MKKPLRVLMVDDSEDDVLLTILALEKGGYDPVHKRVEDAAAMRKALLEKTWDVILCDYQLPQFNGLDAINLLKETGIDIPLIIVSGAIGEETAVECMRLGACDYIMKRNLPRLSSAIERELKEAESRLLRKRAEEALGESESKYKLITEKMTDIVWILDMDLRTVYVTPSVLTVLGFSQEERMLQPINEQLTPDSLSSGLDTLARELALEEQGRKDPKRNTTLVLEYYHKDGSTRWMDTVVSGIRNDQGVLTGIHGVSRDITERKKAEESLRESEEKYRNLFDNANEAIFVVQDGKLVFLNPMTAMIIGYSGEELTSKPFAEFIHPDDRDMVFDRHIRRIKGEELPHVYSFRIIHKDGNIRWVELNAVLINWKGETATLNFLSNITERKQSEDEVRLNEARLTSLLKISQYKAESIQELLDYALAEAIMLTGSKFGYIYYYDDQKKEFTLNTWSKDVMKECSVAEPQSIYQLEKTGLWGEAVRQAKVILVNDFQAPHPLKRGYPEGHAPLHKFLTLPIFSGDRIIAVVAVANKQTDYDESDIRQLDLMMSSVWKIADRKRVDEQLLVTLESLRKAVAMTIQVMVSAVEARDPYTSGHQIRVANIARAIATEMGLPQEKIDGLRMAGSIHDIGKLSIPADILSKPGKLSEIEFSLIKEHAYKGYEMLKDVESPWPLAEIVYQHHERMDGSGYPRNLKGDEILLEARIMAVADVVESMASHRPYRAALGINAALEEIEKNRKTLYDANVADACLRLFREKGFNLEGT
ncbi:MAG: PAS domain S-box protein [Desulfobacterales bacterium]